MTPFKFLFFVLGLALTSCASRTLPSFSNQYWHVDAHSGHAVSSKGLELAFGGDWMVTDTTLMQNRTQISAFPKLENSLAKGLASFPEIGVDSLLFYNPHRGLLFFTYHLLKPLKPSSEIYLYDPETSAYSKEYARIFGRQYTAFDESGWENGPVHSVFTNVHYSPKAGRLVLLQRLPPMTGQNIAVLQIIQSIPSKGEWWKDFPRGFFTNKDLRKPDNIEGIGAFLHSSRNLAVENLRLLSGN